MQTMIPNHLFDSLVHGVKLASETIEWAVSDQMAALAYEAENWSVVIEHYRERGFTPAESLVLWAVVAEAAVYAMTNNYHEHHGHPTDAEFDADVRFTRQADEILVLLGSAQVAVSH